MLWLYVAPPLVYRQLIVVSSWETQHSLHKWCQNQVKNSFSFTTILLLNGDGISITSKKERLQLFGYISIFLAINNALVLDWASLLEWIFSILLIYWCSENLQDGKKKKIFCFNCKLSHQHSIFPFMHTPYYSSALFIIRAADHLMTKNKNMDHTTSSAATAAVKCKKSVILYDTD